MTDENNSPHFAALQELQDALDAHRRRAPGGAVSAASSNSARRRRWSYRDLLSVPAWKLSLPSLRLNWHPNWQFNWRPNWRFSWRPSFNPMAMFDRRYRVAHATLMVMAGIVVVLAAGAGALWWRLSSGPIMLDLATPWLTAAIEQNLGSKYHVEVGGTVLERDAQGHTALRLRDIVLRDASGAKIAVAPKAEVGISGTSLLMASPRAQSFRLVDAAMTIRIDPDGRINVLVGGDKPFVSIAPEREAQLNQPRVPVPPSAAPASKAPPAGAKGFSMQALSERGWANNVSALLAWIDEVGKIGLDSDDGGFDGHALKEVGIANGSLTIDDRRGGSEWKLSQISLKLNRPKAGGVALTVLSDSKERPWVVSAALTPSPQGRRRLQFEARKVVLDDLLALRMSETKMRSDTQVSASIDADITSDGTPDTISGSVYAEGGTFGSPDEPEALIPIGSAEFGVDWSAQRGTLRVPFKVTAGAARYTLRAEFAAPQQAGGAWPFAIGGGWIVLDPVKADEEGMVLKRVVLRGNIDTAQQRVVLEQGDLGTKELGGTGGVTVAMSGRLDYAGEARLALGIACNPMPVAAMKRLWPAFVAPKVRDWVIEHITNGNVERMDIATNATLRPSRESAAAKLAATWPCASPVGVLTIIALGNRSVAIDIAAKPRYASAAKEFGSAMTANSSPSAGMIESTGAEKVSAASSGSRIVRSARSTRSAAPNASKSPPKRPPSAGSVVASTLATRSGGLCDTICANTPLAVMASKRSAAASWPNFSMAESSWMRSNARFSACTEPCSGTGGGASLLFLLLFRRDPFGASYRRTPWYTIGINFTSWASIRWSSLCKVVTCRAT